MRISIVDGDWCTGNNFISYEALNEWQNVGPKANFCWNINFLQLI